MAFPFCAVPEAGSIHADSEDAEDARRALENELSQIISQTNKEEQEYQSEQDIHMQVRNWSLYFKDASVLMSALSRMVWKNCWGKCGGTNTHLQPSSVYLIISIGED